MVDNGLPRVMFCSQSAYTGGGMESWMESLDNVLTSRGWDVIVALAKGMNYHNPDKYAKFHRHAKVVEIRGSSGYRECRVASLLSLFSRYRPDIVIPVGLADALYATALWKSKGNLTRLVTCLHSQTDGTIPDLCACKDFIDLAISVSRRGARKLDTIMVGRSAHIPTGVRPPTKERKTDTKYIDIAMIGRLDHGEKRIMDLINLVPLVKSERIRFHVIGKGHEENELKAKLEGPIAEKRVLFYGQLTSEDLFSRIYPAMDVLLVLSAAEGGPIVAWEAMRNGVIPVVSDYVGRKEEGVIKDGENSLVFPIGDMKAAAARLKKLLDSRQRMRMSDSARNLPQDYTLGMFGENWDRCLKRIVEGDIETGAKNFARPISPGRLSRAGVSPGTAALIRRVFRMQYTHEDAGGEWPSSYPGTR